MAISTDLDGPQGRREHAGRAGDGPTVRTDRIRRAQRHSRVVRAMRLVLPVAALAIAGYYALTLLGASRVAEKIARTAIPKILPANLTMSNPRYRGVTKDGGTYAVTAKTAKPSPGSTAVILLQGVSGQLAQKNGATLTLTALSGAFNTKSEVIELNHNIKLKSTDGGWARLKTMRVETTTGIITSAKPVEFGNPQSKVSGNSLRILQKSKEMTVSGKVVAIVTPPKGTDVKVEAAAKSPAADAAGAAGTSQAVTSPAAETAAAAKQPSAALARMFTGGKGPVEITSDRLDIDDIKKTAIFVGNVRAKQGDATLTTPELRIAYDGAPSGGLTGASDKPSPAPAAAEATAKAATDAAKKTAGGSAKITSIVAANPVAITQAPATSITSATAAFDAASQRATMSGGVVITRAPDTRITGETAGFDDTADIAYIDGNVVLAQGADRRATGQHAEFHNTAETALMTGDVVLTQGKNVLRGRRLHIDQKAGRTELTAPPMAGSGPGRISAHFVQSEAEAKKSAPTAAKAEPSAGGMFNSFRTDPGAPVDVTANQLEVLEAKNVAIFRGEVEARQGTFEFRTAELNAVYTGSAGIGRVVGASPDADKAEKSSQPAARLTHLHARGKVIITSRNGQKATGDWADFNMSANTVTLGGTVVLTQGRNVVKGTRLVIDMATGESIINTDNSAAPAVASEKPGSGWRAYQKPSRPSAVFFPQELRGEASAKKSAKPAAAAKPAEASGWQSTTAPARKAN